MRRAMQDRPGMYATICPLARPTANEDSSSPPLREERWREPKSGAARVILAPVIARIESSPGSIVERLLT